MDNLVLGVTLISSVFRAMYFLRRRLEVWKKRSILRTVGKRISCAYHACMHGNEMPALICCNFVANFILFFFFSGLFYGISCDLQASAGKRICSAGRNSVLSDEEHFTVNFPRIFSQKRLRLNTMTTVKLACRSSKQVSLG